MELRINKQARGVRILSGEEARKRRQLLNQLIQIAEDNGFEEIILPSLEPADIYTDKAGKEVLQQMYTFEDKRRRDLCLRPEVTATIQLIADKQFKKFKDKKLWYFERCWRYERPQEGRYREFFQFGLEIINPSTDKHKATSPHHRGLTVVARTTMKVTTPLIGGCYDTLLRNRFTFK